MHFPAKLKNNHISKEKVGNFDKISFSMVYTIVTKGDLDNQTKFHEKSEKNIFLEKIGKNPSINNSIR